MKHFKVKYPKTLFMKNLITILSTLALIGLLYSVQFFCQSCGEGVTEYSYEKQKHPERYCTFNDEVYLQPVKIPQKKDD